MAPDIDTLCQVARERGASDLHLSVGLPPILRIQGQLVACEFERLTPEDCHDLANSILDPKARRRFARRGDLQVIYRNFRASLLRQRGVVGAVLHSLLVPFPSRQELRLPAVLEELADPPRGLVLVTGPPGSGRSTTLNWLVNHLNEKRSLHLLLLDSPIEVVHRHKLSMITQRDIGQDAASWEGALRAAWREDPDLIVVGQLRGPRMLRAVLETVARGFPVLACGPGEDVTRAVQIWLQAFPRPRREMVAERLASVLRGVVCQRLVPSGSARVLACEVQGDSAACRNLIREGRLEQLYNALQTGARVGSQTFEQDLFELHSQGLLTRETALASSDRPEEMDRLLKQLGDCG